MGTETEEPPGTATGVRGTHKVSEMCVARLSPRGVCACTAKALLDAASLRAPCWLLTLVLRAADGSPVPRYYQQGP